MNQATNDVRLAGVVVGGGPAPWQALGLRTDDAGRIAFGNGALEFVPDAEGIVALAIDGIDDLATDIEGIALQPGRPIPATEHPLGAFEIDHIVVMTDSLERTSQAVTDVLGLECRRIRETGTVRQAFHRFADQGSVRGCIIELVENPRVQRPGLFGLVLNLADLDRSIAGMNPDLVGAPKPAVQPGRRIATVRASARLGVAVALMSSDA